ALRETALRQLVVPLPQARALPLAQDPFGLFERWMGLLEPSAAAMRLQDGYLVAREGERSRVLVLGEIDGDGYDQRVQERAVAGYQHAVAELEPGAEVWRTGTVFYATAARAAATRDTARIALGSIAGIALLMLLAFRSLRPILLGLLSAGIGILFGVVALVSWDAELHLISIVFGASLIGEAVDYSILLFAARLAAGPAWNPERGVAQIRPGLIVAVGTSLLAYGLLAVLPFPGLSQVARFALIGLAVSFLTVLWLLPAFLQRPSRRDPERATRWAATLLDRWSALLGHRATPIVAALLLVACVPGWLALAPNDDVRLLVPRDRELAQQETAIRALTGLGASSRFFLVRGADEEQVLARESALVERLRML